jgi:hypothetical protein
LITRLPSARQSRCFWDDLRASCLICYCGACSIVLIIPADSGNRTVALHGACCVKCSGSMALQRQKFPRNSDIESTSEARNEDASGTFGRDEKPAVAICCFSGRKCACISLCRPRYAFVHAVCDCVEFSMAGRGSFQLRTPTISLCRSGSLWTTRGARRTITLGKIIATNTVECARGRTHIDAYTHGHVYIIVKKRLILTHRAFHD